MPELKPRSIRPEQSGSEKKSITDAKRNVRERSGRKLKARKTLYRLQGSLKAYLDNCTAKKRFRKRPVANYGSSGNKEEAKSKIWTSPQQLVSGSNDEKIKLQRAQGGCPGTIRRRRTWQAAKSYGEPQAGTDP